MKEVMIINKAFWFDENNEVPERGKFSLTSEGLIIVRVNIKCRYKILYTKQFKFTLNIYLHFIRNGRFKNIRSSEWY